MSKMNTMNTMNKINHNSNNYKHDESRHNLVMLIIMIFAGLLSSMNIWVDKFNDIKFHLNDIYMIFLMIGWMFLFMGIYYLNTSNFIIGLIFVIIMLYCIRNQVFINENQYLERCVF